MKPGDLVKLDSGYLSTPMFREPKWTLPGIGAFRDGEVGTVLEFAFSEVRNSHDWVRILTPDRIGWCNSDAVEVINETR